LTGSVPVAALESIADFHLGGDRRIVSAMQSALAALYAPTNALDSSGGSSNLLAVSRGTLDILQTLQALDPAHDTPKHDARYPDSSFGLGLKQIAMLIKAEVGLEVAAIDVGGWDTHFAQGSAEGGMAALLRDVGDGLSAFHADALDFASRLTVVVMSEFGRRAQENASLGTDHGHGSVMWLMGGHVAGRRVHGRWPGLADGQLVGPGDLAVTTDYRDVLAEVCQKRLNNTALDVIFPNYKATARQVVV